MRIRGLMLAQVLYGWLGIVGLLDLALVSPALRRATHTETVGRLVSTLAVLGGLVLCSASRVFDPPPVPPLVAVGLTIIDLGLLGYALYLPERGVLHMVGRRRVK